MPKKHQSSQEWQLSFHEPPRLRRSRHPIFSASKFLCCLAISSIFSVTLMSILYFIKKKAISIGKKSPFILTIKTPSERTSAFWLQSVGTLTLYNFFKAYNFSSHNSPILKWKIIMWSVSYFDNIITYLWPVKKVYAVERLIPIWPCCIS